MRKLSLVATAAALALTLGVRAEIDLKNFDLTVKPQDDFFHYANGTWMKHNPIPADQARWASFNELDERNQSNLRTICERGRRQAAGRHRPREAGRDFYASGMDEAAINALGAKPLQPELERIAGVKAPADVLKVIAHLQSLGIGCGFRFGSSADLKQSDREIASLGQGGTSLPERGYYFNDDEKSQKIRQQYVAHVANLLVLAGEPRESATVSAQAVMAIETKLALASLAQVQLRDPNRSYHKMKVSEAQAKTPGIDFKLFFAERGAPAFDELNLAHPDFFKAFEVVLTTTAMSRLAVLPPLAPAALDGGLPERTLREGKLRLQRHRPHGRDPAEAALEAGRRRARRRPRGRHRRGARPAVRRGILPARGQGAHGKARRGPAGLAAGPHRRA
jgi:predicted metalloendopeptidase